MNVSSSDIVSTTTGVWFVCVLSTDLKHPNGLRPPCHLWSVNLPVYQDLKKSLEWLCTFNA